MELTSFASVSEVATTNNYEYKSDMNAVSASGNVFSDTVR